MSVAELVDLCYIFASILSISTMELVTTPQAARLLGVAPTTVKRWVDEGRLSCVRTPGGHRRFHRGEVARVLAAGGGQVDDFSLRCVEQLLSEPDRYAVQSLLMGARGRLGSWWAVADVLAAALTEIGRRWGNGQCSVGQEHVASECLRRGLSACLATLPSANPERRCLLATVQDDQHTLGLSLAELCAAECGWRGLWLGSPTPTTELVEAIESFRPGLVAISASAWSSDADVLRAHFRWIAKACRAQGARLVLGGRGAWPEKPTYGARAGSFEEFAKLLTDD